MNKVFRVLVVDDKRPVLNAMQDWIEHELRIAEEKYKVELLRLHVEIVEENNKYEISSKTFENLNEFCQKPFNLMLLDFGFHKQGVNAVDELYRMKELNPQKSIRELIDQIILNPSHIVSQSVNHHKFYKKIKKNFIDFSGSLYVYTYLPSKIEREYTPADVRRNVTNKQFPKASIEVIDARKELFNNTKFDSKYDDEFYPFIISKFISKIIHIEIAKLLLNQTEELRMKARRIQKNNKIIALSAILPSVIAGVFIPSLFSSFEKGDYTIAFAFLMTLVVIVFVLTIVPKILEKNI